MTDEPIARILGQALFETGRDEQNITDALFKIAYQIKNLGNADASTPMGAIEALGAVHKEGMEAIAGAIHALADAISNIPISHQKLV